MIEEEEKIKIGKWLIEQDFLQPTILTEKNKIVDSCFDISVNELIDIIYKYKNESEFKNKS